MNTKKVLFPILALVLVMVLGLGIVSADDPSDPLHAGTPSRADVTGDAATVSANGLIVQVDDPATIPCEILADIEDVIGGGGSGTNYDAILVSGGLKFAERFSGQTRTSNGDFDVLSGTPSYPLALQIGAQYCNVNVAGYPINQVVDGLGPLGYPIYDAIGEGSLAVMFPNYQSQFKFDIIGVDGGGSATLNFFKADGSSLGTIVIAPAVDQTYGFRHTGGIREIAGFSIHNTDPAGIGYDNICYAADPIEVAKDYRYTNVCFVKDNDLVVDCPEGTSLGTLLPTNAEGDYIVEAVVKNDVVKSYNPGQYYAVSTVNVLVDVDELTIEEDWCDCTDISALSPAQGGGSVVIVQVGPDGVAYQILDAKSEEVTVDTCKATAELEDVPAGTTILMYVKFGPAQKHLEFDPGTCENTNTASVSIDDEDSASEVASAMLELIEKV